MGAHLPMAPSLPASGMTRGRVLYVQYMNPAAYPPLEHSAVLLAEAGCDVRLLGAALLGDALTFVGHPRISVALMAPERPGWRQKIHYVRFILWTLTEAVRFRPDWVYASDPLSAPAALCLAAVTRARIIYHEHDEPVGGQRGVVARAIGVCRRRLARRAVACVVPSAGRAPRFTQETGRPAVAVVWNTPLAREATVERPAPAVGTLRVLYHGSIVPARLPLTVIDALAMLPPSVTLTVAGYDPAGGAHLAALEAAARATGVSGRLHVVGTVAARSDLLALAATCDVGLALLPSDTTNPNEQTMLGASNKPFDYLASGAALVVSDRPEWTAFFAGCAVACRPESAESVADALRWFLEHPAERRLMAECGRQRILEIWNYEQCFGPVLNRMIGPATRLAAGHVPVDVRA
jgi:glycosyltransferase involved in cell wall biosynthesis